MEAAFLFGKKKHSMPMINRLIKLVFDDAI
jgi:hypothetical protein